MNSEIMSPAGPAPSTILLTTAEAAARLGCSTNRLYVLRHLKLGPPSVTLASGRLAFDLRDLDEWASRLEGPIHQVFSTDALVRINAAQGKASLRAKAESRKGRH